jgi:hypothetical protein
VWSIAVSKPVGTRVIVVATAWAGTWEVARYSILIIRVLYYYYVDFIGISIVTDFAQMAIFLLAAARGSAYIVATG